jgi:hypothetical protein
MTANEGEHQCGAQGRNRTTDTVIFSDTKSRCRPLQPATSDPLKRLARLSSIAAPLQLASWGRHQPPKSPLPSCDPFLFLTRKRRTPSPVGRIRSRLGGFGSRFASSVSVMLDSDRARRILRVGDDIGPGAGPSTGRGRSYRPTRAPEFPCARALPRRVTIPCLQWDAERRFRDLQRARRGCPPLPPL